MLVRKATKEDAKAICKICSLDLGYPCETQLVEERIAQLDWTREQVFVAENTGNVIGFVHVERYATLYMELMVNVLGLAVSSSERKQGAGKALMTQCENWAKEIGAVKVRLNSGATRVEAHQFYRNLGYLNEKKQIRFMKEV